MPRTSHHRRPMGGRGSRRGGGGRPAAPAWTPASAASLIDWYPSANIDLVTPQWTDAGPSGHTLAKTTNNPIAGIEIDGRPTLNTSGGSAVLKHTTGTVAAPLTMYLVIRTRLVATTQLMIDGHDGVTNRNTLQVVNSGIFRANAGVNLSTAADTLRADTVYLLRATIDGLSSTLWVTDLDGTDVAGPASAGTTAMDGLTVGGSNAGANSFQGDIAEVIRCSSDAEAADVEAYLLAQYPSAAKATWTPANLLMTGDSLCVGQGSTDGRGSRSIIREAFEPVADDVEPGVRTLRFAGTTTPDRCMSHAGVSGRPITTLSTSIAAQLAGLPHVCLILIGTNDCRNNGTTYDGTTTPAAYGTMLSNAFAASPTTKFVCFTVPSLVNGTHDANVDDLNGKLPGLVATAVSGGMDVVLVDLHAVIDVGTDLDGDGVHLNDSGYAKKAALEIAAIRTALA